jgi:hypothetical protein
MAVCLLLYPFSLLAQEREAEAARLQQDIALYAETNACGEEPLADRLRAALLLREVDRGRSGDDIRQTRQAFLDAWRERARRPAPSTAACRTVLEQAQARADGLRR